MNFFGLKIKIKDNQIPKMNLIFHVHGGGFFAQTSKSHMSYLSSFVNEVENGVLISIDYNVAPKNKYPELFQESMLSYEKIVKNCEKMFGFKASKIVLIGDSGGGHLCLSIVKHAIACNIRKPDGMVLFYPCTRIVFDVMTPSLMMAGHDSMIEYSIMGHIQTSVLDLGNNNIEDYEKDDYLNVFLTDPKTIQQFPKTTVVIASDDPLKDECFRLSDLLLQNGVNVNIKEFLFHPHGFMNLTSIFPYFRKTEKIIIKTINEYFH